MLSDSSPEQSSRRSRQAWLRALERTSAIERSPHVTLPVVIERLAERFESTPALIARESSLSYRALAASARRYARWAIAERLVPGEVVALLMASCPEYFAIWLGLTRAGLTVALLNSNLPSSALEHSLRSVGPRALIAGAGFEEHARAARAALGSPLRIWTHGSRDPRFPRIDRSIESLSGEPLSEAECPPPALGDRALYIYTSGTTGLPKAAIVSHQRLMMWTHWFSGLMGVTPADRMYDCLPLYHSVGGVVAAGATLVGGGSVVVRERFSASGFWEDIRENDCTLFQYIGELCRYLLAQPPRAGDTDHRLRLACGNGLRVEVWTAFRSRFRIPQILEYYAATEGTFSLYNCEGRPGAIGRIPPFIAHRYPITLVRHDPATGQPLRDRDGRCVPCAPGEAGEALGQVQEGATRRGLAFEGYTDSQASRAKVLRDVLTPGDAWYRTGDLMRCDEQGFFFFVDRLGDTFRWKGENVSTAEVAAALSVCLGVADAAVYGVEVPGTEGRAGMAALVVNEGFDLAAFRRETEERLPHYARPLFLRIVPTIGLTGTFKPQKQQLAAEGFDPRVIGDPLYFDDRSEGRYVRLDAALHGRLATGLMRL